MLAGSPPSAMTTGMRSPLAAISRQWAAPTLCRCQCIASVSRPSTWIRYIPTLRIPREGSVVMTIGRGMYRAPSPRQGVRKRIRAGAAPPFHSRRELADLGQLRQHCELAQEPLGDLQIEQLRDAAADRVEVV